MTDDIKRKLAETAAQNEASRANEQRRQEEDSTIEDTRRNQERLAYGRAVPLGIQNSISTIRQLNGSVYIEDNVYMAGPSTRVTLEVPGKSQRFHAIIDFLASNSQLNVDKSVNGMATGTESYDLKTITPQEVETIILEFVHDLLKS